MAFAFSDLQVEVKRRATKNQGGTQFDTGIKNTINTSMWRVAREARWRTLRRTTTFNTVAAYSTGTATVTNGSVSVTLSGGTTTSGHADIGRYVKFTGSAKYFKVATITSTTAFTIDQAFDGTSASGVSYSFLGKEEYVLPIQIGHSAFFWHRQYGRPLQLIYNPAQEFYTSGALDIMTNIPVNYRMWGAQSTISTMTTPSTITILSTSSADTSIAITVFGIVNGLPDYEIITTNGSDGNTPVVGSKIFSSVDRISKNQNTTGSITVTQTTLSQQIGALPVGNTTTGPMSTRIQLYPLPNAVFPINCYYYKLPYQLVNDGDTTELGEEFSEAIILLATAKLKAEQNQSEDADYFKFYQDEIASLKATNVDKIDFSPNLKRPGGSSSNLYTGIFSPIQTGSGGMFGWGQY